MAEQKNTLSDLLKRLTVDANNMNAFLYSLSNMLESKSENVTVSQYTEDGSQYTITVPSFGYLKGKIEDINNKFDSLLSANGDTVGVKSSNGDIRKFELKKVSQLVSDLDNIENVTLNLPNSFKVRNNWFFESFLNPLLFVTVDISSFLTQDIDRFVVKRIIINSIFLASIGSDAFNLVFSLFSSFFFLSILLFNLLYSSFDNPFINI